MGSGHAVTAHAVCLSAVLCRTSVKGFGSAAKVKASVIKGLNRSYAGAVGVEDEREHASMQAAVDDLLVSKRAVSSIRGDLKMLYILVDGKFMFVEDKGKYFFPTLLAVHACT